MIGKYRAGVRVNVEVDLIGKYVEKFVSRFSFLVVGDRGNLGDNWMNPADHLPNFARPKNRGVWNSVALHMRDRAAMYRWLCTSMQEA